MKTNFKTLISFTVTAKLICVFFAYAKIRFSHDEAHLYFAVYCRKDIWNEIHLIIESLPVRQSHHVNTPMNKIISTSQCRLGDKFKQAVQTNTHRLCCVQEYLHLKVWKKSRFSQCACPAYPYKELLALALRKTGKHYPRCGDYSKLAASFLCVMHHWHYECAVSILKSILNLHLRGYFSVVGQGRRRFLKSGTAIERRRRSAKAKGPSRGRAREGNYPPCRKRGSGDLPREIF